MGTTKTFGFMDTFYLVEHQKITANWIRYETRGFRSLELNKSFLWCCCLLLTMHLPVFRTSTYILVRLNIDSPSHAPFCLTIKSLHTRLFKIKSTSLDLATGHSVGGTYFAWRSWTVRWPLAISYGIATNVENSTDWQVANKNKLNQCKCNI